MAQPASSNDEYHCMDDQRPDHEHQNCNEMLSFLAALQQADSQFPNGSFAFSNGMEGLAALGARMDAEGLAGLFEIVLRHRWAECDRVILVHAWRAGNDIAKLAVLDARLEAATLPASLRRGARDAGAALMETHARLGTPGAAALKQALAEGELLGHLPVMQGALWRALGLDESQSQWTSGYLTVSGLGSSAIRLGEAGALTVQKAMSVAMELISELSAMPVGAPERLAGALPWLDLACARQEELALRLFSN